MLASKKKLIQQKNLEFEMILLHSIVSFKVEIQIMFFRYLLLLMRVNENEYDLYMRMDTNTNGHRQWFYFSVKNTTKTTIKFNIYRFKKRFSLFQRGMRPYVKSLKGKKQWMPGGKKIAYKIEKKCNEYGVHKEKNTFYLSFSYTFQYEEDEVFFAAAIPYTYTFLNHRLNDFSAMFSSFSGIKWTQKTLTKTMCGLNLPLFTIEPVNYLCKEQINFIIINARTHAGETSGSWVLDGFLEKIFRSPEICKWIEENNICFQIVPMLNPDGVFVGNYRTGIIGDDFNRKFLTGKKQFFPEIYALKKLVSQCKKKGRIGMFIDLHGHSILKNSFIYGPMEDLYRAYPLRTLPFRLWHSSKYFRFSSCKFKFQKELHETARVFFQAKQQILSYTCQNSLGLFHDQKQTFQMLQTDYKKFGQSLVTQISELLTIKSINELEKQTKRSTQTIISSNMKADATLKKVQNKKVKKISIAKQSAKKKRQFLRKQSEKKQLQSSLKDIDKQTEKSLSEHAKKFPNIEKPLYIPKIKKNIASVKVRKLNSQKQSINQLSPQNFLPQTTKKQRSKQKPKVKQNNSHENSLLEENLKHKQTEFINKNPLFSTAGVFTKKVQQTQKYIKKYRFDEAFKTRRQSDTGKFLPENFRKKVGDQLAKKFTSSASIGEDHQQQNFGRSVTFDSAYLSSYVNKIGQIEENQQGEVEQEFLQVISENFSEDYESINDSDSSSEDLCEKQKNYILEWIINNRKKILTNGYEEDNEDNEEETPLPVVANINGFKQIRFKSIDQKQREQKNNILSIKKQRKEPFKLRDFTHKSLGRQIPAEQGMIHIIQKKKLNERFQGKKMTRDPYVLVQIKNKHA